jgi:2-iminobutanoate/2-iminopropanoate deaminase
VREELARSGLTLRDVVNVSVYLTDLDLYHRFNRVYEQRFPEPWPARAVVEVNRLPGDAQIELHAIARRRR